MTAYCFEYAIARARDALDNYEADLDCGALNAARMWINEAVRAYDADMDFANTHIIIKHLKLWPEGCEDALLALALENDL